MRLLCILVLVGLTGCVRLEDIGWPGKRFEQRLQAIQTLPLAASAKPAASTKPVTGEPSVQSAPTTSPSSRPGQPVDITLDDLRATVLRDNLKLRVKLLDPEIARTRIGEEEGRFDAKVFGGARYKRSDQPELDSDLVSFTSSTNKDLDKQIVKLTEIEQIKEEFKADFGVAMPLTTGGQVKVTQSFDQQEKRARDSFEQYLSGLKFSISQPLLRNAGSVNLAALRIAAFRQQSMQAKTKLAAIRLLANAEKAYWRVFAAQKIREVREQQYDLASRNLTLVQRRVEEGLSPDIEIIRAEVGVAERLEARIVAETALRVQQRALAVIRNQDDAALAEPPLFVVNTPPQLVPYQLDRERLLETALRERMELLDLEIRLSEDALRVDVARNQTLPLFVLDFSYGLLDRSGSLTSAWNGMFDFEHSEVSVGLRGELQVTNQAALARLRRAVLQRTQRLATIDQRKQTIVQEVHDTADLLLQNWQRIRAARKNVAVAGANYEAEQKQFAAGTRTMREVLEALASLGDAQLREVRAIVAYQVSQIDLAFATGTLLGYARAELDLPQARIE